MSPFYTEGDNKLVKNSIKSMGRMASVRPLLEKKDF